MARLNPAWLIVLAVAVLAGWAGYRMGQHTAPPPAPPDPAALAQLMTLPLTGLDGQPHVLAEGRGKVLVVNFWATWCPPCRKEMPSFSAIHQEMSPKGVQFVGIALDDADKVRAFSQTLPVSYPLFLAPPSTAALTTSLGNTVQGLPFTLIIDRQGQIDQAIMGRPGEAAFRARLEALAAR